MNDIRAHAPMLNWLRAAVLGANDGIVSVASILVGVAGAGSDVAVIMLAGGAGMFAGAFAMAAGEYVSVSTQRDAEMILKKKGFSKSDISEIEGALHIDHDELTNPWHAALASGVSFVSGALVPLCAAYMSPAPYRISATFLAVVAALALTGVLSAHVGGANKMRATVRLIAGGTIAMAVTYLVGLVFGVQIV